MHFEFAGFWCFVVYILLWLYLFMCLCHCFKRGLFYFSGGTWGIFLFFFCAIFLFCFVLITTKIHGGKVVMSTVFFLLPLPIMQRSGLQGNEAQNQTTITSVLELTLPVWLPTVAQGWTPRFLTCFFFFKWGSFTFLNEVLWKCIVDVDSIAMARKPSQSNLCLCVGAGNYLHDTMDRICSFVETYAGTAVGTGASLKCETGFDFHSGIEGSITEIASSFYKTK